MVGFPSGRASRQTFADARDLPQRVLARLMLFAFLHGCTVPSDHPKVRRGRQAAASAPLQTVERAPRLRPGTTLETVTRGIGA